MADKQNSKTQTNKATELYNLGFSPVKLGSAGDDLKRPQLLGWTDAEYTAADLAAWPAANNIGIRCGKQRDGKYLYVFDFDHRAAEIFPAWLEQARKAFVHKRTERSTTLAPRFFVDVHSPPIVKTSKGYHVYVRTNAPQKHNKAAMQPNESGGFDTLIEVIGERRQVVSAGSNHPSGANYELVAGKLDATPTVTTEEYNQLFDLAESYDLRPAKSQHVAISKPAQWGGNTGELAGVTNCLDYARAHIAGKEQTERNGEIRFAGNGGLLITEDGSQWFCHSEQTGGGLVSLVAWHKNISIGDALAMLGTVERPSTVDDPLPAWAMGPVPQTQTVTQTQTGTSSRQLMSEYAAIKRGDMSPGELAGALLGQDAIMVAPMRNYFDGEYPSAPGHTCKHFMALEADAEGLTKHKTFTGRLWRKREAGKFTMTVCPACQHDYAWRAAQQLEYEADTYADHIMPLRYQTLPTREARKIVATARKWRERYGIEFTYWLRPLVNKQAVLIHNLQDVTAMPDLLDQIDLQRAMNGAKDFPRDRDELHALILEWIVNTSQAKTAHSKGWGGEYAGTKGAASIGERKAKPAVTIATRWAEAYAAIADYSGLADVPINTGLHIVDVIAILEAKGIPWGVLKGQKQLDAWRAQGSVTRSVHSKKVQKDYVPKSGQSPQNGRKEGWAPFSADEKAKSWAYIDQRTQELRAQMASK